MCVNIGGMVGSNYTVVKLPTDLIEEVDKLVGRYGFRSRPEVIKSAIRRFLFNLPEYQTPELEVPANG